MKCNTYCHFLFSWLISAHFSASKDLNSWQAAAASYCAGAQLYVLDQTDNLVESEAVNFAFAPRFHAVAQQLFYREREGLIDVYWRPGY